MQNKLKEYWITISVQVEAHDEEEANKIGRDVLARGTEGSMYRILGVEVSQIEEA